MIDRVAGVVSALITRDDVKSVGEKIDHFSFTLIAPLGPQYNQIAHLYKAHATLRARIVAVCCRTFDCNLPRQSLRDQA